MNKLPGKCETVKVALKGSANRGSNRGSERFNRSSYNNHRSRKTKFGGWIDVLKGHIYDCTDSRQSDLYTSSTKEIASYVATALKWQWCQVSHWNFEDNSDGYSK